MWLLVQLAMHPAEHTNPALGDEGSSGSRKKSIDETRTRKSRIYRVYVSSLLRGKSVIPSPWGL